MLELKPFAAVRFSAARFGGDVSRLIAPPYDVLEPADKDELARREAHNIVSVDLPHVPPKAAGPPEVYQQAAARLRGWLAEGILVRDPHPAVYVYHQGFTHEGRSFTRRMLLACLRLRPFSDGVILPHERTFGGPKEDRLALMKATRCQLSPIFGLYADPQDQIGGAFAGVVAHPPEVVGTLDGVENRVWVVSDRALIERVAGLLASRKVYIADGHHRYGTALLYRDWLAEGMGGVLPADHAANFVMFVLASMDDPGCLILPYHRTIGGVDLDTLVDAWREGAAVAQSSAGGAAPVPDLRLHDGVSGREVAVRFSDRAALGRLEPNMVAPWYELDYAYLHRYLIDELLAKRLGRPPELHYLKSAEEAIRAARAGRGVAVLTNPTPMAHLRAVSEAGGLMPQKSTYFYPKLATGLAIHMLE